MHKGLPVGSGAEVHFVGESVTFHPRSCVHGVTKQAVPWHLVSHHSCQDRSRVDAHSDLHRENLTEARPSNTPAFLLKLRYNLYKTNKQKRSQVVSSGSFDKSIGPCSPHRKSNTAYFHDLARLSCAPFQ